MLNKFFNSYKESFHGLSKEVWLLSAVSFINRFGTMILPFLSVYLTSKLGFSKEVAGQILMFFGIGSLIGSFLGGHMVKYFGHFAVQVASLFFAGIAFMSLQFIGADYWQWCIMLAVSVTLADAFRPAMFVAVKDFSTEDNRTRSVTLIRLMINLGIAFGPAIGGFMALKYGYKWLFILDGGTCILAAFFMLATMRHTHEVPDQSAEAKEKLSNLKSPWTDKYYLFLMGMNVICILVFAQFLNTYTVFMKEELGYNEAIIGWILAANGLLIFISEMPFVAYAEKKWDRDFLIAIGCFMMGLSFFILIFAYSAPLLIIILSVLLITYGEMINFPFVNSKALDNSAKDNEGEYMGIYTMVWSVAMIISPLSGMYIADNYSFSALWILCGVLSTIAAFGFYFQDRWFQRSKPIQ